MSRQEGGKDMMFGNREGSAWMKTKSKRLACISSFNLSNLVTEQICVQMQVKGSSPCGLSSQWHPWPP
jgi:hypothetical protein